MGTVTFGTTSLASSGSDDIFIAKLDTYGNWIWVKKAGGAGADAGYGIAIDAEGNCYITGHFQDTAGFGGTSLVSSGASDIFITKLDSDGNWQWAKKAGSASSDIGNAISTDEDGNCFVVGYYQSTASFGESSHISSGSYDMFVAGMDTNGNWLWSKSAGGNSTDIAYGISTDADGACYVTGSFMGEATFGVTNLSSDGSADIFVAKLDSDGDWLWAVRAGGTGSDTGNGISTDVNGNCYITGSFSATASFGSSNLTSSGANEVFCTKLDTDGNWLWANRAGGSSLDIGYAIASDPSGNCYIAGAFVGTANFGSVSINPGSSNDIFIAKFGTPYPLITTDIQGTVDFGNAYLGTASQPLTLWIKNTGMADLVIDALSLQQIDSAFSIQEITLPFTIAAMDSISINLVFTPMVLGQAIDSLFIANNSPIHAQYALRITGTAVFAEPMAPTNVTNHMNGNDIIITWDDVTQTVADTPIVPDFYFIYFNGSSDPQGLFYFLGRSFNTQFTHYDVTLGAEYMFYRVRAIKLNSRNVDLGWIDRFISAGMTEEEVSAILKTLE